MGNFNMKFILLTWLRKLGFKSKHCETVIKSGELAKAYMHRQRTDKCETTLYPPMGCSLTWMARWKHSLAASNASCAHGFVSQHFPFCLKDLQNMPNKLWASSVAREGWRCADGCISPSSSMCGLCLGQPSASPIHLLPPSSRSTSYTVIRAVTPFLYVFKLLLLLRAKPLSQLLLGFWLTWRQCKEWVSGPSAPWQRTHLSLLLGWVFRRYLSLSSSNLDNITPLTS